MRPFSSLLRLMAWLLMILVVIALPLSLFGRAVGQLLFTENGLSSALSQNLLDEDVFASIIEEVVKDSLSTAADASPQDRYFSAVLSGMDHDRWVRVTSLVAPQDLMRRTSSEFFSGFYAWLDGDALIPESSIDLSQWKENIEASKIEVVEIFLESIPKCSPAEVLAFGTSEELPFCRPPEPFYSNLLAEISAEIAVSLDDLPDSFSIFGSEYPSSPDSLDSIARAKQFLQLAGSVLRFSWMVVIVLYLLAIPMGSRSLVGFFKWSGVPLVVAGGGLLFLSFTVFIFGGGILSGLSAPAFSQMPDALSAPMTAVLSGMVAGIARPMLWQSMILLILGCALIVAAVVVERQNSWNKLAGDRVSPASAIDDDDSPSPTGMFG